MMQQHIVPYFGNQMMSVDQGLRRLFSGRMKYRRKDITDSLFENDTESVDQPVYTCS